MKLRSLIVLRPFCSSIVLAFAVLLLTGSVIPFWIKKVNKIKNEVTMISKSTRQQMLSTIRSSESLLLPMNASASKLVRVLSSSLYGTQLPFPTIETQVAPVLFQALSTISHLSQISYIGLDGFLFSYYTEGDQILALYSNSSFSNSPSPAAMNRTSYVRPVNRDTGKLYGEAVKSHSADSVNASWFQEALNNTNGYSSLSRGWNNAEDLLFLNTAILDGLGAVSLGFPVKPIVDLFFGANLISGKLYLATKDGKVLTEGIPNTRIFLTGNLVSLQLVKANGDQIGLVGNVTCEPETGKSRGSTLKIWETKYTIYCSPLQLIGVQSVYVLALPHKELDNLNDKNIKFAFWLLLFMLGVVVVCIFIFVFLIVRAARREMYLCGALINQMEATQQAERKSMNKSNAYARASHDVRASLAGITGLIELSRYEVPPGSKLDTNLKQMETCNKELLGLLNSILDTSKIEAGKMELEEEDFNLAQLLEDVVDLFFPAGMRNGVDVILEPFDDGSISKFSHVRGDRGKLNQILRNLLSNAVKFTSEGYVSVRVWAKKPTFENSLCISSGGKGSLGCLFFKNNKAFNDLATLNKLRLDPNRLEYVFEINDTGKGIPKEKQKSVFENYVQVRETDNEVEVEGTGLGLGIVQSLVRLMGGEIEIVDKEVGEKGSCFRFNTFFTTFDSEACGSNIIHSIGLREEEEEDVESHGSYMSSADSHHHSGSSTLVHSPKLDGSQVVLFLQSDQRRKVSQKFMENLGIKVYAVNHYEHLSHTLKKIKQKLNLSHSGVSSRRSRDLPLSALDGTDHVPVLPQRRRRASTFVLVVIDTSAGPFGELSRYVADFRRDLNHNCNRVVWIDKPGAPGINIHGLDEDKLPQTDLIISKPFHGSRLRQVVGLLPEFGGSTLAVKPASEIQGMMGSRLRQVVGFLPEFGGSMPAVKPTSEIQAMGSKSRNSVAQTMQKQESEIQEVGSNEQGELRGKKVLVAEDTELLRKIAVAYLSRFGATVESCENGAQAVELVCIGLNDQKATSRFLPYDYIFMDCEMPVMNGIEATRCIREKERHYGVHIPIIAVTGHAAGEEANMMTVQAGMDYFISKPLSKEKLLQAIADINSK